MNGIIGNREYIGGGVRHRSAGWRMVAGGEAMPMVASVRVVEEE